MKRFPVVVLLVLLVGCHPSDRTPPDPVPPGPSSIDPDPIDKSPTETGLPETIPTDLTRLQGYWEGEGPGGTCSVHIVGEKLFFYRDGEFWFDTEFSLSPDAGSSLLHATILRDNSKDQGSVGSVVGALFEFRDDRLILAAHDVDSPPDSVDAEQGVSGRYDLVRRPPREGRIRPPVVESIPSTPEESSSRSGET